MYSKPRCTASSTTASLQDKGYGVTPSHGRAPSPNPCTGAQNCPGFPGSTWILCRQTYHYVFGVWRKNSAHSPSVRCIQAQRAQFPTSNCYVHEPRSNKTNVRAPFHPQELWRVDNKALSCAHGDPRRSGCRDSESCRSLVSVFHLRRWIGGCRLDS